MAADGSNKRKGSSSSSCCHLPNDIILFEILTWLPVRAILKFKCVCKCWYRLISGGSHNLAMKQFHRSSCRPSPAASGTIFIRPNINDVFYHGFDGTFMQLPVRNLSSDSSRVCIKSIEASTNGLCCLLCLEYLHDSNTQHFIYMYNPFTGKGERVPLVQRERPECFYPFSFNNKMATFGLAFEPLAASIDYAYKLVEFNCIYSRRDVPGGYMDDCEFSFFLYSSDSGHWVKSRSKFTTTSRLVKFSMTKYWRTFYAGGKVYWDCYSFAVQYDIERDIASHMEMPECLPGQIVVLDQQVGVREGRLICTRLWMPSHWVEVWVLDSGGGDGNKERWKCKERVMLKISMEYDLVGGLDHLVGGLVDTSQWCPCGAMIYEDEERGDYLQVMCHASSKPISFRLGLAHYSMENKKVVSTTFYKYQCLLMLTQGLTYRHYDSLLDHVQ